MSTPPRPPRSPFKKGMLTGHLVATPEASEPQRGAAGAWTQLKHVLIGKPLASERLAHERIPKFQALAVLASDALSSTAYATEEILKVLLLAGAGALAMTLPISIAIAALLAIVAFSYRQTIYHYPKGGGTYVVSKDNLGPAVALVAGSALMIDYVLTVAVSASAGIDAVTSALPALSHFHIELALLAVAVLTLVNLRGVRESAAIFALPTYAFIFSMFALLGIGAWRVVTGLPPVEVVAGTVPRMAEPVTLFLLLRAFASGCSAMTGTEAISDGVPAFKEPQAHNAVTTLIWMATILGGMFLGVSWLAQVYHVVPKASETVVSQIARAVVGRGPVYYAVQASTALILVLAANTSFSDFPRLAYFMAQDRFLPRQFVYRGDRLALSTGILVLGGLASALIVLSRANLDSLIPLYAVGVFISFTLSQASMVKRWWTRREPGWKQGLIINGVGAATTAVVATIITVTKFVHGAWLIALLLPTFVSIFFAIRRHYLHVAQQVEIPAQESVDLAPLPASKTLVLVSGLNRATAMTLRYAFALSKDVTALHVTDDPDAGRRLRKEWEARAVAVPLVILESPYRSLISPVLAYLDSIEAEQMETPVTVVLSEFVPRRWWEYLLHNQDAFRLKGALFFRRNTAVIDVPFHER